MDEIYPSDINDFYHSFTKGKYTDEVIFRGIYNYYENNEHF